MRIVQENNTRFSLMMDDLEAEQFTAICDFFEAEKTDFLVQTFDQKMDALSEVLEVVIKKMSKQLENSDGNPSAD